jgi:hypothetical protein
MKCASRRVGVTLLAPVFLATGCLIPYAYPKLSYVPGYDAAGLKATDVRAFRVDVTADQADLDENGEYTLTEIIPSSDKCFPPQAQLSLERGVYVLGPLNFNMGRLHTTRVRLYSPGYQLVELESWCSTDKVRWQLASDWNACEKAIDDLLRHPTLTAGPRDRKQLPKVSASSATMRVFVFAAGEYEKLIADAPTPADAARVRDKARALVETKPAPAEASNAAAGRTTTGLP